MSISFFSPICKNHNSPVEKLAFLRITTDFFNFGQPEYTIRLFDSQIFLEEKAGSNPHWIKTLLRIVAICTILIPLIMCVGIWVYRRTNNFKVYAPNRLNTLPLEILKYIYENAGPACLLQLASTSKINHAFIENENSFKQFRFILKALEQIPRNGNSDDGAINIIAVTKILCALDLKLAFLMAESINNSHELACYKSEALATYVKALALINPNEALKVAHTIIDLNYKAIALASVAECFFASDPKKSKELAELAFASIRDKNNNPIRTRGEWQNAYLLALSIVSNTFDKISCSKRAKEISDLGFKEVKKWNDGNYSRLSENVIENLVPLNWETTLQISEPLIEKAILAEDIDSLIFYTKIFITKAPKALAFIKNIISTIISKEYLCKVSKLLTDLDEKNCLEFADLIINFVNKMDNDDESKKIKAEIYCYLARAVYRFNPVQSQNLVDLAITAANPIKADNPTKIHIAKAIGLFNNEKSQILLQEIMEFNSIRDKKIYFDLLCKIAIAKELFPLNPEKAIEKLNAIDLQPPTQKIITIIEIGLVAISK